MRVTVTSCIYRERGSCDALFTMCFPSSPTSFENANTDDNEAKRLKSRWLFCMNLRELSLSSWDIDERHREREREREKRKKKRNRGSNEGRRKNEKSNYAESEREKERDEETGEGVDSLGDFVRAGTRFPNRSNLQLANRRRRQPSNKSNSRRNGRGPKGKKRVRRDFAPRMIRSSRTKSISCRLDYAVWHTFLRRSNSSSLYVHTYVRTNVHLA